MRYIKTFENFTFDGTYINVSNRCNKILHKTILYAFNKDVSLGKIKKISVTNLDVKYIKRVHEKLNIPVSCELTKGYCVCDYFFGKEKSAYARIMIEKYENDWYFVTVANHTLFLDEKYICNEAEGLMDLYKYLISNNYLKYTIQEFA